MRRVLTVAILLVVLLVTLAACGSTAAPTVAPPPPKPAGWQEMPQDLQAKWDINYYFPGEWITMTTQPMPTVILALDPTFFPNTELREFDVPAGTTNAQFREIMKQKYPSQNGGEFDNFQVLEQGNITLDNGMQTVYMIYSASRMGYSTQAFAVFMVRGTQGFILTGSDYPVTFSDNKALLNEILKTLYFIMTPTSIPSLQQTGSPSAYITGDDWVKMTYSQKNNWVKVALDAMVSGGELSRSKLESTGYYVTRLDSVFSNPNSRKSLVVCELTAFTP